MPLKDTSLPVSINPSGLFLEIKAFQHIHKRLSSGVGDLQIIIIIIINASKDHVTPGQY